MNLRPSALLAGLLTFLLAAPLLPARQKPPTKWLVITNVTVVDVTDGSSQPGVTVVIRNDRITAIARHALIELAHNVQVVNANGKCLLGGRWDMQAGTLVELRTAEVGQGADLILLNACPLSDLRDTQKVWAAVVKGKFLDRPALDKMLAEAAAK